MKGLELVQSRVQPLQSFVSKSDKEELLAKVMVDFHGEYLKLWTVIAKFFLSLSCNLVDYLPALMVCKPYSNKRLYMVVVTTSGLRLITVEILAQLFAS